MEKKQKIKVKANSVIKDKLILKKDFIFTKSEKNILILNKEIKVSKFNKIKEDKSIVNFKLESQKNKNKNKNILSIKSISKSFNQRPVLKNISFNLKNGQILGLLGPNGCGKTTLFKTISGEISPDSGDIFYEDLPITKNPIHERSRKGISYLQTHKGLFDNLTAYENLYAVLELHINDKDKIEQNIFKLLSYFGLQYLANIKAKHFSAGESKKVACLQRICNKKIKVLLMDEPLSALDPLSIESIKKFILEIKKLRNISIIITEHNVASVYDILDYVILLRDGNIMTHGTMSEVSKNKDAIKYYLGSNFKI
jgi:lipopolysaccharide export system ATP-binding protein